MTKTIEARERYLERATRKFAEHGFHGVSLAGLAQDSGVTKQAVLHFFGTKERLYAEVLTRLAERLTDRLEAIDALTPEARLAAYFDALLMDTIARPEEARLVVRALLDSAPDAKFWPLKDYLDRLTELSRQTPRWREASEDEVLAAISQLIGAIQYFAIAAPALRGMYGAARAPELTTRFAASFRAAVQAFVAPR